MNRIAAFAAIRFIIGNNPAAVTFSVRVFGAFRG